ncbi:hypothetical protein F5Y03DRAFT_397855 [Xylaria venustula]|nr:hypothetical protein F5Y03DRAFT_397855 [Xylaria venustula]
MSTRASSGITPTLGDPEPAVTITEAVAKRAIPNCTVTYRRWPIRSRPHHLFARRPSPHEHCDNDNDNAGGNEDGAGNLPDTAMVGAASVRTPPLSSLGSQTPSSRQGGAWRSCGSMNSEVIERHAGEPRMYTVPVPELRSAAISGSDTPWSLTIVAVTSLNMAVLAAQPKLLAAAAASIYKCHQSTRIYMKFYGRERTAIFLMHSAKVDSGLSSDTDVRLYDTKVVNKHYKVQRKYFGDGDIGAGKPASSYWSGHSPKSKNDG